MRHIPPPKACKPMAQTPRWLRPKLRKDQIIDLGIVHATNAHEVHRGVATETTLWDMAHAVLSWSHVAHILGLGVPEITPQLELTARMITHYGNTGRIEFTGNDYELACIGTQVMDLLAEKVDQYTAELAARQANEQIDAWRAAIDAAMEMRATRLRIVQCRDHLMWYRDMIGQTVELVRDLPAEKCWLSREPSGHTNIVKYADAEVVHKTSDGYSTGAHAAHPTQM